MRFENGSVRVHLSVTLLLACVACGNLSNEDIAFLEALPQKDALHVKVPASASQPLCGPGTFGDAEVWKNAKTTGDSINAGVDGILSLVDAIRAATPTTREPDRRTWGPFPDDKHPGVEIQVVMVRELDANLVPWRWLYSISARRKPANFIPILEGEFFGAQARNGIGRLILHFENSKALGMAKETDPAFPARIFYDLSSDPHTVSLDLTAGPMGFGLLSFDYGYAGYADGHGRFDFVFPDGKGCIITVTANFTARGAGRGGLHVNCGGGIFQADVQQCWNESACLTYAEDPLAFTPACGGLKPCLLGSRANCPP
jgi:hypothetical protein